MYIQVKLLNGYRQALWYKIPLNWQYPITIGTVLRVPLRNQIVPAIVILQQKQSPKTSFAIKEVNAPELFPTDHNYFTFIKRLSAYYQFEPVHCIKRIAHFLHKKTKKNLSLETVTHYENKINVQLTQEQQNVCDFIKPHIDNPIFSPTVLHGVTGSGKTEVYKQLIMHAHKYNKTTILLLPEVTLAIAFEKRLWQELGGVISIFGFHSGCTPKEKRLLWQHVLTEKPILIIGVHLPVLLPISNLGLIIIDEEHDVGYQEKKHPKINSKDAAIIRARMYNIPILFGSATPSLQTLYNVKKRGWHFFQLKKRFSGAFPKIVTTLLTDKKQRKQFWISQVLYRAIKDRIAKKEQVIIFINRRGFSFFVQCKMCSFTFTCSACSVSLTLHKNNTLICHYCGINRGLPKTCPECKADEDNFLKKGIGTQQVVTILQKLFPQAQTARADLDTTIKKKKWEQTLHEFMQGNIDILVGTQTITKGYDFPNVTLVGILWADLNVHFPFFNAAETTLQQLIQVAGRAGRKKDESTVIVQTMGDHPVFSYLNEINYLSFYRIELEKRALLGYPPCKRLAEIEIKSPDEAIIEKESFQIAAQLRILKRQKNMQVQILGPAKPPVHKIKHTYVRKMYLKSGSMHDLIILFQSIKTSNYTSSIFFVPNPSR